jgi:type I restriction enzyme M protein
MIARYDLAKKPNGKWETKVGRDILFIERNLDFLKPGGRMAIVLPQGRFNNSSDKNIRDFIAERCRILAVVGLSGNTFKPHTGTKTSVLLVQKWNDDPKIGALCPHQDDYNIFFATMQKSGKDNSGEKVYVKVSDDSGDLLLDEHNHWIVDHDLFNHDGLTEDGIAEAFIEFAKKENLSFFEIPPANATPLNKGDRGGAFDAVKYQQLMDRLEAVELSLSEVLEDNNSSRFDSEYFRKHYLASLKILQKIRYQKIHDIAYVTDGIHESIDFDEDSNILSFSAKYPKENYFDINDIKYISERQHNLNPRTQFQEDDVIISTVGTIGNCAVVDKYILPANSDRDVGIIRIHDKSVKPRFLSTFLVSRYGRFQSERESTGNVQLHLFIYKIKEIKVPQLKDDFQQYIEKIVKFSKNLLDSSQCIYQQAEDLLLTELGLKDWQPTEESIAVKSFSESFLSSGRLDAEYYQPKYDEIETTIMKYGFIELIKISKNVSTGFTYDSADFVDNGIDIIRINNITQYGLDLSNSVKISPDNSSLRLKDKVAPGAILISMSGSIGLCCCIQDEINAFINQRIMKLYPVDFDGNVLAMIINSVIGKMQLHRVGTGGVQTNLSNSDILNLKIPKLPVSVQQSMSQSINKSLNFRQKSKQLLEIAKIGVEKAIETDEETATAWINQQLESLGVKLIR